MTDSDKQLALDLAEVEAKLDMRYNSWTEEQRKQVIEAIANEMLANL